MPTTIQVPESLRKRLQEHKRHPRQPYAEVIEEALDYMEEDDRKLSPAAQAALAESRKQFAAGQSRTLDEVAEDLGL